MAGARHPALTSTVDLGVVPADRGWHTRRMTEDGACAVAHGADDSQAGTRTLVAVFASPVAEFLLRYGEDLGYRTLLFEPDPSRAVPGVKVAAELPDLDEDTDVVVTDHHRPELGAALRDVLARG